jgi:hypothetical protein
MSDSKEESMSDNDCSKATWPLLCEAMTAVGLGGGSPIEPGPDLTRNAHFEKIEAQLRAAQGISVSQKAQIVAEGLRQIGEHAIAAQIGQAIPRITAVERNTP